MKLLTAILLKITKNISFVSVIALAAVCLAGQNANANVSLRNGNFFIAYTDIIYTGGFEPKVERVYNSKTPYFGMFGHGWGSEYEVQLKVSADGSVVVYEYGGGAKNRFVPTNFDEKKLKSAIDSLVAAAKKAGQIRSPKLEAEYREKVFKDAVYRENEWQKFVNSKALKPTEIKNGTQFISNRFNYQYVTKAKSGFIRSFDNGKRETFDSDGKLVQVADKNGNFIKFTYQKNGQIKGMVDNFNRKIFFKFNSDGLVDHVEGQGKKVAIYKYDSKKRLIYSKDMGGLVYQYSYTEDGTNSLSKISYMDKTTMEIDYHGLDKNHGVKSIKDRNSRTTLYTYTGGDAGDSKMSVTVMVKDSAGKETSKSKYDYQFKFKSTGEEWTYQLTSDSDGVKTRTVYNECCGLPVEIERGGQVTKFDYDKKGRVVKKDTPSELTNITYDQSAAKVSEVKRWQKSRGKSPASGKPDIWSKFGYDKKGNLVTAANSEGKKVKLFYDKQGRIRSMVDQNKREIQFKYNENSKPVEISDPKLGSIRVSYTNTGEIKKIDSKKGQKIALQVTSAFQNLLEIIRPAGVTLNF